MAQNPTTLRVAQRRANHVALALLLGVAVVLALCLRRGEILILCASVVAALVWAVRGQRAAAITVTILLCSLSILGMADSRQVRLDNGDQRRLFWGIPIADEPMEDDVRRALSSLDAGVPAEWVWCGTRSPGWTGCGYAAVYQEYYYAATWVAIDPTIASQILRDVADHTRRTGGMSGSPPPCNAMWSPDVLMDDGVGGLQLMQGWQNDPRVQIYLESRGLRRAAAGSDIDP
jgi:hypothetical protein